MSEDWFIIDSPAALAKAAAFDCSVWVCHRSPVGEHEALVGTVDAFYRQAECDGVSDALRLRRVRWPFGVCNMAAEAAALLDSPAVSSAIVAVAHGRLIDKIVDYSAALTAHQEFLPAFVAHMQKHRADPNAGAGSDAPRYVRPVVAPSDSTSATLAPIDIARMVDMGKDLLRKRQPIYADKFFAKALGVLEAFPEADRTDDMRGSIAMVLGWLIQARTVVGRSGEAAQLGARLRTEFPTFAAEPMSVAARGAGLALMVDALPLAWDEATCSVTKLTALLQASPLEWRLRAQLAVTLYLQGDVERCLTECVKLRVVKAGGAKQEDAAAESCGAALIAGVAAFLGNNHPLVVRTLGADAGAGSS